MISEESERELARELHATCEADREGHTRLDVAPFARRVSAPCHVISAAGYKWACSKDDD